MALYTVPLPSVDGGDEDISRQMRKIIGYLRQLDEQLARHRVEFHWVKGHAGHAENEHCDALAVAECERHKE